MDLSDFDTRQKAEAGVDFPLVVQYGEDEQGEPAYGTDGEPVLFRIRGIDAAETQDALDAFTKAKKDTARQTVQAEIALASAVLVGWSDNFTLEGKKPGVTAANIRAISEIPVLRTFIVKKIVSRANFTNKR